MRTSLVTGFILLFFSLVTVSKLGIALGYLGLLLAAPLLLFNKQKNLPLTSETKRFSFLLAAIGLLWCLLTYFDRYSVDDLDKSIRIVFIALLLLALVRIKINKVFVIFGLALGAFFSFIIAFYGQYIEGISRPTSKHLHPIIFGDISMALGLIVICTAYYYKETLKPIFYILIFAGVLGVCGSFLSGSRGGWIGLPLIAYFMLTTLNPSRSKIYLFKKMSPIVIVFLALVFIPNTGVYQRISQGLVDIQEYIEVNHSSSSVGARIEMWKSSLLIFIDAPFIGVGKSNISTYEETLVKEGQVDSIVLNYTHSHSDYMDSLAERGVLGFALLLVFYFLPIWFFYQLNKAKFNPFAIAGCVLSFCFIDFSLTESLLTKNIGISFYLLSTVFLYVIASQYTREKIR